MIETVWWILLPNQSLGPNGWQFSYSKGLGFDSLPGDMLLLIFFVVLLFLQILC